MASNKRDPMEKILDAISFIMEELIRAETNVELLEKVLKDVRKVPVDLPTEALAQLLLNDGWTERENSFYNSIYGVRFMCVFYHESFENQGFLISLNYKPEELDSLKNLIVKKYKLLTLLFPLPPSQTRRSS
jgi:hypothetical protein